MILRRTLFGLAWGVALLAAAPAHALDPATDWADSLLRLTEPMRLTADYAAAAHRARAFVDWLHEQPGARTWQVREPEILLRTFEAAAALPLEAQRELAAADSINAIVNAKEQEGDYPGAVALLRRQLEIRRRHAGDDAYWVSLSLNDLGFFLTALGDLDEAEARFRAALEIDRRLLGESPSLATSEANVAVVLQEKGDYVGAEPHLVRTLSTYRALLGNDDARVALALNNLGINLAQRGEIRTAEPLLRRALAIRMRVLQADHPDIAVSCYNLASLLRSTGNTTEAAHFYDLAVRGAIAAYGDDHPEVALALGNQGVLFLDRGDFAAAEGALRRAHRIQTARLGEDDPTAAHMLSNLSAALRGQDQLVEAESLTRRALTTLQKKHGAVHPMVADAWVNLGKCLSRSGRHEDAEAAFAEALRVRQACNGKHHPRVVPTLVAMARERACLGKTAAMRADLEAAVRSYEIARLRAGWDFDRATRESGPYPVLAIARASRGENEAAWIAAESGRARLLADLLMSTSTAPRTPAERAREDLLRQDLAQAEEHAAALRRGAQRSSSREVTAARITEAERELLLRESAFGSFEDSLATRYGPHSGRPFDLARVQSSLREDEALVGWVESEDCNTTLTWAYVVRDRGSVAWFALANMAGADSDLAEFQRELTQPPAPFGSEALRHLAQRVHARWFARLEPLLRNVTGLIVVPSGRLLGIPVESLVDSAGTYLADRFSIRYAPSATIHAWLSALREPRGDAVIRRALFVADPPMNEDQRIAMARESKPTASASSRSSTWQSRRAFVQCVRGGNADSLAALPRLRASRTEVQRASRSFPGRARLLLGDRASEEMLARMGDSLRTYSVLHLATHAIVDDEDAGNSALILSQVDLPDPVDAIASQKPAHDGRLTVQEILRRWKLHADLVVLSGCATGLGRPVPEEGYMGFAHALFEAGARNLIVSLWEVDDESTARLMERFYAHWQELEKRGVERAMAEALRMAQHDLRQAGRTRGRSPYEHPWYWSAFVLVGPGS